MQEIKHVAILGAGAMGAFFASRFSDAPEYSTVLVARGQRYDRLKRNGLVVNGKAYAIPVTHPDVRQGNQVTYTSPGKHYFGEATNTQPSERVRRVQAAFDRAGISYETPPDMIRMIWWKFMVNVGMNPPSAVMRAPYGVFQSSPEARALMETLMREVIALARVEGVNLTEQDIADWYPVLQTVSPQGETSMLQDIEAGRKTEIEMFAGKVVELGKKHGIPTPVNETMLWLIHVLEQVPAGG
jgi:2-dehydropantoate 2-reductase